MKINPFQIVRDHLRTLQNAETKRISVEDLTVFFLVPPALGAAAFFSRLAVDKDVYNVSITFFGIFIALLLNIQVAIFAIFQRKWDRPADKRLAEIQDEKLELRRQLMSQLNSNLSYLVLYSCVSLFLFLVFFTWKLTCGFPAAVSVLLYAHFLLTLFMVVKRTHALFQKEYDDAGVN